MIPVEKKTIVLPIDEAAYEEFIPDNAVCQAVITDHWHHYPEFFPPTMSEGWSFHGLTRPSKKQDDLRLRRILTKTDHEVWQIRPSCMMPYMTCDTKTAEKILFLANWAPDWA